MIVPPRYEPQIAQIAEARSITMAEAIDLVIEAGLEQRMPSSPPPDPAAILRLKGGKR